MKVRNIIYQAMRIYQCSNLNIIQSPVQRGVSTGDAKKRDEPFEFRYI